MSANRKAFTLIELMVVVVIIVMLAALASTAYFGAMQSAREVRTIGIIAKLDAAISDIYETYEFRFEHIEDALDDKVVSGVDSSRTRFNNDISLMSESEITELKRKFMYDLMRMEMPSIRQEVEDDPKDIGVVAGKNYKLADSAVRQVYQSILADPKVTSTPTSLGTSSAELLYLIIANLDPEALENFTASEIGDTDNNGLSEFIDGWGRPIAFLRFAPGFTDTDRQPDIKKVDSSLTAKKFNLRDFNVIDTLDGITVTTPNSTITKAKDLIINQWQDPFDPDMLNGESWFLYPVVVSAGRDGKFGIVMARKASGAETPVSLYDPFSEGALVGSPYDPDEDEDKSGALADSPEYDTSRHNDNIHNHTNFR
ncbi:MAG: prepilin-type N-terminal cleavage/methylation domain-containing protein [Planctomycetaceae bacterium]|jgi:prepilin-type N-terminal cleavage/methylation domain-containing protein|nr:prepilin-type N-terminal cleavage/methylation domain-containing protein [Planctomycetaceae bacterium]